MMNLFSSTSVVSSTRTATRSLIMSLLSSPSSANATRTATSSSTITPPMVKIISQETIKPSSPTPYHLRTHKLSLLDHLAPPMYMCFTLFYDQTNWRRNLGDDIHRHMKKTLAETLTDFYTLAGKVKHNHEGFKFVDCTDDGVEYLEATVNAQLHETINKDPDVYLLNQFLPLNPCQPVSNTGSGSSSGSSSQPILAVQVNTFDCGRLAVGVSMSHEVSDITGLIYFMQAWAAKAHGGSNTKPVDPPLIGFESLFPVRALPEESEDDSIALFRDDIVTKRFVFDSSKISSLREKMMLPMYEGSYLTRVEVLTTFMWRRFMNIHQAKIRSGQTGSLQLCVGQAVNVRKRINLSGNSFGNLYFSSWLPMFSIDGSTDKDYECFMSQLRNTVRNINGDYIRRELQSGEVPEDGDYLKFDEKVGEEALCGDELETLQSGEVPDELETLQSGEVHEDGDYLKFDEKVGEEALCGDELETLFFTSFCRMGYYEVDFGWGKPVWMCPGTIPFKDIVVFTDSKSGDGIEVWVYMIQEDIDALELDQEFLAFVS